MSKSWSEVLTPVLPEKLRPQDDSLTRFSKTVGYIAIGLIALGVLANIPDIKRYIRMTMM